MATQQAKYVFCWDHSVWILVVKGFLSINTIVSIAVKDFRPVGDEAPLVFVRKKTICFFHAYAAILISFLTHMQ